LYFLKTSNINIDSMRKIYDFKNKTLKVERVPNSFENLTTYNCWMIIFQNFYMEYKNER